MTTKNPALGKGLGALIPKKRASTERGIDQTSVSTKIATQEVLQLSPSKIRANPHQPRKTFRKRELVDLIASIKKYGILQPLTVVECKTGYELIAGERRLRAAKEAGLKKVPALLRSAGELEQFELSLIENIQRDDLNPIERAEAYKKLIDEFGLTHDDAAKRLSVSRPVVSNTLRLLTLPPQVQKSLADGELSEGQAKVLLELKSETAQTKVFDRIISQGLTVEQTKGYVKTVHVKTHDRAVGGGSASKVTISHVGAELQRALGTKVSVKKSGSGGVIEISFFSEEELHALVEKLMGRS